MRFAAIFFLSILLMPAPAVLAATPQTHLPAPKRPAFASEIVDEAGLLPAETLKNLRGLAAGTEYGTGYQFVTVITPSIGKGGIVAEAESLVLNRGIGKSGKPGVLLLVAVKNKQAWIIAGPRLATVLPQSLQQAILSRIILPNFRLGNLERGTVDGARAVMMALQGAYASPLPAVAEPESHASDWLSLGIAAAFIVGAMGSAGTTAVIVGGGLGTTAIILGGGLGRAIGRW